MFKIILPQNNNNWNHGDEWQRVVLETRGCHIIHWGRSRSNFVCVEIFLPAPSLHPIIFTLWILIKYTHVFLHNIKRAPFDFCAFLSEKCTSFPVHIYYVLKLVKDRMQKCGSHFYTHFIEVRSRWTKANAKWKKRNLRLLIAKGPFTLKDCKFDVANKNDAFAIARCELTLKIYSHAMSLWFSVNRALSDSQGYVYTDPKRRRKRS